MSLNIVLSYQNSAPQSFKDGMQAAANILDSLILNNITVNIQVTYDTSLGTSAEGSDFYGLTESYSTLQTALASHETSAADQTFVNSLPNTSSVNGVSSFYVPAAVAKALGQISATNPAADGGVWMGSQIPSSLLVGVALHELTHAMGRETGVGPFDLFRYTSPEQHLFSSSNTELAAYFSIDGGFTDLADFGLKSDPSDFLNPGPTSLGPPYSSLTPNDPFNEIYSSGTLQNLTAVDKELIDVLGFNTTPATITVSAPLPNTRDIFWHDASGANQIWALNQSEQIIAGPNLPTVPTSWSIAGIGDFNKDGISDLLWRDASGANQIWNMDISEQIGNGANLPTVPNSWSVAGIGNFAGNELGDIVWHNANGQNLIWNIQNDQMVNGASLPTTPGVWSAAGIGQFLGNGLRDLLWHNTQTGQNLIWNLQGDALVNGSALPTTPTSWTVAGIGAFGGNGQSDILWHNANGQNLIWIIQGDQLVGGVNLPTTPTSWNVAGIEDFTGSGTDAILWHDASGANLIWNMQNNQLVGGTNLPTTPTSWNIAGVGINSITSGLSTEADGDPALAQMVQAMASFAPDGAATSAIPVNATASDLNSQLVASNPVLGSSH
jgi:hypothetical protein